MSTTQRNFIESMWDFFCSLKLTIFLLISLALTSIIGTVLPQGQVPPEYVAQISPLKLQIYTTPGSGFDMSAVYKVSEGKVAASLERIQMSNTTAIDPVNSGTLSLPSK